MIRFAQFEYFVHVLGLIPFCIDIIYLDVDRKRKSQHVVLVDQAMMKELRGNSSSANLFEISVSVTLH